VRRGIGSDGRIGPHFLYSGVGYGGSCFPKDVKALLKSARDVGHELRVVAAVEAANEVQKEVLFKKIVEHYGGRKALRGKVFGLWGLAFKANTDDMREAPSIALIRQLAAAGARVRAYDPAAGEQAKRMLPDFVASKVLTIVESASGAVEGADALAVVTEWQEFRSPDFSDLASRLADRALFDGRNLYDPQQVADAGLVFHGIGRVRATLPPATRLARRSIAGV
jgi:UDPglucose 6-dehydrogenase